VLTPALHDEFSRTGVIKLPGAFAREDADRMCGVIWSELGRRYEIDRGDPSTWNAHPPTGLKSSKKHRAFAPILGPVVRGVLDELLGPGEWRPPRHFGQVLVTMPTVGAWRVPHRLWHGDFPYDFPFGRLPMLKLWALCADHDAGGGATPQLIGSHRVTARFLEGRADTEYKRVRDGVLRSHPWLRDLTRDDGSPDRNERFMCAGGDVDGVPVRVIECTGSAGDVYVTHPWVMHSIATNASTRPRMMRSLAVYRDDYLRALRPQT
jgi:hypothetical protein